MKEDGGRRGRQLKGKYMRYDGKCEKNKQLTLKKEGMDDKSPYHPSVSAAPYKYRERSG